MTLHASYSVQVNGCATLQLPDGQWSAVKAISPDGPSPGSPRAGASSWSVGVEATRRSIYKKPGSGDATGFLSVRGTVADGQDWSAIHRPPIQPAMGKGVPGLGLSQ